LDQFYFLNNHALSHREEIIVRVTGAATKVQNDSHFPF